MRKKTIIAGALLILAGVSLSAQETAATPNPTDTAQASAPSPATTAQPEGTPGTTPTPQSRAAATAQGTAPTTSTAPRAAEPQTTVQPQATSAASFTQQQLDTALAPIALYPDSLLAQLLMATTYPDQVLEAAKWSKEHPKMKGEEAVKAVQDKNWDPSVASLVAFPQVLEMLSSKPEWVRELGEMFLADPDAVMNTIQGLRKKAKEAGNLKSTKEQKVVEKQVPADNGGNQTTIIEIQPADPQVVYVPAYNPTVVYGPWWYPTPPYFYAPPYYNPVAAIIGFGAAIAVGHALWSHWDWHHHDININVNRYNNINVNKRLDIAKQKASWRQNLRERNPRFDQVKRDRAKQQLNNRMRPAPSDRKAPALNDRTRDLQRARAKQQLKERGGVDLDRARQNLQRNPERVNKAIERANRMTPTQKQQLQNRVGNQRPTREIKRPSGPKTGRPVNRRPQGTRPTAKRPSVNRPNIKRPAPRPTVHRTPRKPAAARPRPKVSRPSGSRVRRAR